jgi:hypothetical protein
MPAIEILVDGLDHPECVCWDPGAELLWAGGETGQLYRVDLAERLAEEIARAPGFVLGVAADGRGRVVACCSDEGLPGVVEMVAEDPQGTLLAAQTNVAFAGPDLDQLVCANLGRWHLSPVECGLRGAPLHYPTHWAADA